MPTGRPRVILNDRALRLPWTGVAHYIAQLIAALAEQDPGIDLLPFYQRYFARWQSAPGSPWRTEPGTSCPRWRRAAQAKARGSSGGQYPLPTYPGAGHGRRWPPWLRHVAQDSYNLALKTIGRARGYHVYHEPNHIPAPWPGPIVTTIHDLSVLRSPRWHPPDRVRWYDRDFFAALPRSRHFITVSQFSKHEMVALLGIAPARITPIALAPRPVFGPRPAELVTAWLTRRRLPRDYLLYAGTIEPRKNVDGLLAAYARLPSATRGRFALLMAGASGWGAQTVEALIRRHGLTGQVRVLGYVEDEELAYLYAGARALVWPTFYEGFGLPPLECMASGTPVITSNTSSIPEVVGDAGILVDPHDVSAISDAIRRVLEDRQLAQSLSARGLVRSRKFSWARTAAGHAAIYRQLADRG